MFSQQLVIDKTARDLVFPWSRETKVRAIRSPKVQHWIGMPLHNNGRRARKQYVKDGLIHCGILKIG